jgi:PPOX class probable F420-dependent enzyme
MPVSMVTISRRTHETLLVLDRRRAGLCGLAANRALATSVVGMLDTIDPEILANSTGVLATLDANSKPELTAVWFVIHDGHVLVSINRSRKKARNLQGNSAVSFLIYHPETVNYFAEVRGTAALIPDDDYKLSDMISPKYGADFRTFDQPGDGRLVIDIMPTKVLVTDVRG